MVAVTINGQSIEVQAGSTVLEAARLAGLDIPTLCDHPSLKPYGGCRLCVVEVEGMRTLQTSCTLPVTNGMVVHTDSPAVKKAREFVLTLLFSERNHFCMYCQKTNGDCELQNAAYGEGMTHWPIQPAWKPYPVDASHPYFVLDHNRCILCRRCVRACDELVGSHTLSLENRGASTMVVADYGLPVGESSCIRCGTCVQVCPTGALIDRVDAYLGKEAEFERIPSVCAGCSVGCGIELVVRDNRLVRVDGDWEHPVNGGVLCEAGHYLPVEDDRPRLTTPLVRKNGSLEPATWEEATAFIAGKLAPLAGSPGRISALASTRLTAEALASFKELFVEKLGGRAAAGIEAARMADLPAAQSLKALKDADCVVVVGADLAAGHQVAGFFIKRSLPQGTNLVLVDSDENGLAEHASLNIRTAEGGLGETLRSLATAVQSVGGNGASSSLAQAARLIAQARKPVFVAGALVIAEPGALEALVALANGAPVVQTAGGANSLAARRYGLQGAFNPEGCAAAFLALGDDVPSLQLVESLSGVPFLAVQASYASPLTEQADVVLPVGTWAEQAGHYLNLEGRLQAARAGVAPAAWVRSNEEALSALAACLGSPLSGDWKAELVEKAAA